MNWKGISFTVVLCAVIIGCVKQIWQVSYIGFGNDYTSSSTLLMTENGFLSVGYTRNENEPGNYNGAFVVNLDRNGTVLWETLIPAPWGMLSRIAGGKLVARDRKGYTYLAWGDFDQERLTIYKLDPQGQVVGSWVAGEGYYQFADDLKVTEDGIVYVSMELGHSIKAFNTDGSLLWDFVQTPSGGLAQSGAESTVSISPYNLLVTTLHILPDGKVLSASADALRVFTPEGNLQSLLTNELLNLDRFSKVVVDEGKVWVVGIKRDEGHLLGMSLDLSVLSDEAIGTVDGHVHIDSSSDHLCIVKGPDWLAGKSGSYDILQFSFDSLVITPIPVVQEDIEYWQMVGVVATDDGCYVAEYSGVPGISVSSTIRYVNRRGHQLEAFDVPGATVEDFAVEERNIYQVGVESDDSILNVSFSRHQRY